MCHTHYAHYLAYGDPLAGNFHPNPRGLDAKIDKDGPNGCWLWMGTTNKRTDLEGYAQTKIKGKKLLVHRLMYERHRGPIPEGMQLDHLCRNHLCVNPDHLEPVTPKENLHRSPLTWASRQSSKTHCKWGHEFTPENTQLDARGHRICAACRHGARGKQSA